MPPSTEESASADDLQAALQLFENRRYEEAAQAIPDALLTAKPMPPSPVFEILTAAGRGHEALALMATSEGSPDRAAVEAARAAAQADRHEAPEWELIQVGDDVLIALLHWASGQRHAEFAHRALGGQARHDVLMELYRRHQVNGHHEQAGAVARLLCRPFLGEAEWLSQAWVFTREPLVLAQLLREALTDELIEQGKNLLDFQAYQGPAALIPALLHAAGNRGDLELVDALLDWPGVNWSDERNPELFRDQVALIHAVYHPTPLLPERDVQDDPAAQLRADLLRAGALVTAGHAEQGRGLAEQALRSFAQQQATGYDLTVGPMYDLVEYERAEYEVWINNDGHIQTVLIQFANDPEAPPALQALALLAVSGQWDVTVEDRTLAAQDALGLAGDDPWIRIWAHGLQPASGDDLKDLRELVEDLQGLPADQRQGHALYPNENGWTAQTVDEARAYHRLLVNLPAQQDDANDLTREWAFDVGQWRENLETFNLRAEVIEACRIRLGLDPESKQAQFSLSYHLLEATEPEHWAEVAALLSKYVMTNAGDRAAWHNLGLVSTWSGQHTQAAGAFERVAALGGDARATAWARSARERSQAEELTSDLALIPVAQASEAAVSLGRAYWAVSGQGWIQTVKALASEYGLNGAQVAQQARLGVEAVNPSRPCTDCGTLARYQNRSDVPTTPDRSRYTCSTCMEAQRARQRQQLAQQNARRLEQVQKHFAYGHTTPVDVDVLTLRQATFLLALIRVQSTEDFRTLLSLTEHQPATPLGANAAHSQAIVETLLNDGIIVPHPSSRVEAFEWTDDEPSGIVLSQARYTVRGTGSEGFADITERLVRKLKGGPLHWSAGWQDALPTFWRELVQYEARAYLEFKLADFNLKPKLGEKTEQTLRELSDDFSLGQIWNMTWQATQSAAATRQKDRVTNDHAVNIATSTLRRRGEHYRAEGLGNPKPSRRDFDMPMPGVSQVLFIHGLGLTELGYISAPPLSQE